MLALTAAYGRTAYAQSHYCTIRVVDQATSNPIGGVSLTTTNGIVLMTDTQGVAAFYEPGLMGRDVWFTIDRAGYQINAAFGFHGARVHIAESTTVTIPIQRTTDPDPGPPTGLGNVDSRLVMHPVPTAAQRFVVHVVDMASGRGIPLVAVTTPRGTEYTDSAGVLGFYDIDRMGQTLTFTFTSDGYSYAGDGGMPQTQIHVVAGGSTTISMQRVNIAERLYRTTGQGIYRESALLGMPTPTAMPQLNGAVMGQDSALATLYHGRVSWIWGDTVRPEFPLGNFSTSGATSELMSQGGLDPQVGVDLTYYVGTDGFCRAMVMPDSRGPTWLDGLVTVQDAQGHEHLFAQYGVFPALAAPVESGLLEFNDTTSLYDKVHTFAASELARPTGPALHINQDGADYVYYASFVRVPARAEAIADPSMWEAFTPYRVDGQLDRAADGTLQYAWRHGAPPMADETPPMGVSASRWLAAVHMTDPAGTGLSLSTHGNGDIEWSPYRQRYTRVVNSLGGGTSALGDIWYAEADTALGPWVYARRVVSHQQYTMYNPRQHPYFAQQNGRVMFFEGTYTRSFSSAPTVTPRYDYNQIMFRLDLDDPRMVLPVPVYDLVGSSGQVLATRSGLRPRHTMPSVGFQAPDRQAPGTLPVRWSGVCAPRRLQVAANGIGAPLFYALPADTANPPGATNPLFENVAADGRRVYTVGSAPMGFVRASTPTAYVWPSTVSVRLPVEHELPAFIADAGDDLCVRSDATDGSASVTLDASGSRAATAIASYTWRVDTIVATGASATIRLPAGLHAVTLTVVDSAGAMSSDEVLVEVSQGGTSTTVDSYVDAALADAGLDGGAAGRTSSCGCRIPRRRENVSYAPIVALVAMLASRRSRRGH